MLIKFKANARAASNHLCSPTLSAKSAAAMYSVSSVARTVPVNSISNLMGSATQLNSDANNTDTVTVLTALEDSYSRKEIV